MSSLQQQVTALVVTTRAGQDDATAGHHIQKLDTSGISCLDNQVEVQEFHHTEIRGSGSLKDNQDMVVNNATLECTWRDSLAAYYYLNVIKSLSHAKRQHNSSSGDMETVCVVTSDTGDVSTSHGSSDKPSVDVVSVASSVPHDVDVNVYAEAGSPRNNGDICHETASEGAATCTGIVEHDDPERDTVDAMVSVGSKIRQVHEMSTTALCEVAQYLLWDIHATRCQLTATQQFIQKAVSAQTGKHTDPRLTRSMAAVPAEKEHIDKVVVAGGGQFSRVLSGDYIPMTGGTTHGTKLCRPHELIMMSPVKSYSRSPFLLSPAMQNDSIEEFEEMSSETDVCSSQCTNVSVSDMMTKSTVEQTRIYTQVRSIFSDESQDVEDAVPLTVLARSLRDTDYGNATDRQRDVSSDNPVDLSSLAEDCTEKDTEDRGRGTKESVTDTSNPGINSEDGNGEYIADTDVSFCVCEQADNDTDKEDSPLNGQEICDSLDTAQEDKDTMSVGTVEDSSVTYCNNMPDEWYGLPLDVKYTKSYMTLSQLVQERGRITQQLQQLPSSVKVMLKPL